MEKNLSKMVHFSVVVLILRMEEKSKIFGILGFIISRKVNLQLKWKKKKKAFEQNDLFHV